MQQLIWQVLGIQGATGTLSQGLNLPKVAGMQLAAAKIRTMTSLDLSRCTLSFFITHACMQAVSIYAVSR